jgi:hypothetical protein
MIRQFTKQDFERALPVHQDHGWKLWQHVGVVKGEHVYVIPVHGTTAVIHIRSSVGPSGHSFGHGNNSILIWAMYVDRHGQERPLFKSERTTRQDGWQGRLYNKLHNLYGRCRRDRRCRHLTA